KGRAFPSLTAARDCQPSPAGGRRSASAQTDSAETFFLFHRARRIFFLMSQKENGGRILAGQAPWREPVPRGRRPVAPHLCRGSARTPSRSYFEEEISCLS